MKACQKCERSRGCTTAQKLHRLALVRRILDPGRDRDLLRARIDHYLNVEDCLSAALSC